MSIKNLNFSKEIFIILNLFFNGKNVKIKAAKILKLWFMKALCRGCLKSLLLLIRDIYGEKLSPSICHCEEWNDVAIFNFIDQKVSFWILTIRYKRYKCYRSPRHFIPRRKCPVGRWQSERIHFFIKRFFIRKFRFTKFSIL